MRWEFAVLAEAAFRADHYKDLRETGNRARKVSGTQGSGAMHFGKRYRSALRAWLNAMHSGKKDVVKCNAFW